MARSKIVKTAALFDNYIFELIKKGGEIVRDGEGNPIVEGGKIVREITPAMLGVIERRMHHCGMSGSNKNSDSSGVGGAVNELVKSGKLRLAGNGRIPPAQATG